MIRSMPAVIETERLTKRYGRARGIEDVSMSVERGEVFGFLGPNGAGKTTTIRTLLDLLHPTSGSARLFGLDSQACSVAIRARLGNLPGEFSYDERLTGREMLELCAAMRGCDLSRAEALAERFRADLSRRLGELSRGNRQKVGLIQALFHDPELLVLDEPTGGLDPLMQEEFLAVVAEERDRGATVFLSSHDLDEVQRVCDRVAIIRDGRLVTVEAVETLRGRADHDVAVRFAEAVDARKLERLPGVTGVRTEGDRLRFHVSGDLDPVVKAIAAHRVSDLEVTRPTLEELFLTYYRTDA
jgi:beta-exotoxin I transport system ATP-binding protein